MSARSAGGACFRTPPPTHWLTVSRGMRAFQIHTSHKKLKGTRAHRPQRPTAGPLEQENGHNTAKNAPKNTYFEVQPPELMTASGGFRTARPKLARCPADESTRQALTPNTHLRPIASATRL